MYFLRNFRNKSFITNNINKRFTQNACISEIFMQKLLLLRSDIKLKQMINSYGQSLWFVMPLYTLIAYGNLSFDDKNNVPIHIKHKYVIKTIILGLIYPISLPYYFIKYYIFGYKTERMIDEEEERMVRIKRMIEEEQMMSEEERIITDNIIHSYHKSLAKKY